MFKLIFCLNNVGICQIDCLNIEVSFHLHATDCGRFFNVFNNKWLSSIALVAAAFTVAVSIAVPFQQLRTFLRSARRRCRSRVEKPKDFPPRIRRFGVVCLFVERMVKALTLTGDKDQETKIREFWMNLGNLWKDWRRLFLRDCDYTVPDLIWGYCN